MGLRDSRGGHRLCHTGSAGCGGFLLLSVSQEACVIAALRSVSKL